MITLDPKYQIGQRLWHQTGGEYGILTDVTYRLSSDIMWYHVTFDPSQGETPCREFEISAEPIVI